MKKTLNFLPFLLVVFILNACKSKEEQENAAEGKSQTEKKSFVKGIGEGLKESGKEAAEFLSEGVGEVIKGSSEGFDKSLSKIKVTPQSTLVSSGITLGRTERYYNDSLQCDVVTLYCIFHADFKGDLKLIALDKDNTELGRVQVKKLKETAGEAKYIDFVFDKRTPLELTTNYQLHAIVSK